MIILDIEQGSPAWLKARLGIPTASQFHRIMTPKTRKLAASRWSYMHELLEEWLLGTPHGADPTPFMARGTRMEESAVRWYEFTQGVDTRKVGLMLRGDGAVGASPDALVGEDGGLEVKCPSASIHIGHLIHGIDDYYAQVQGAMWISGRAWWDLLSYNPTIPPVLKRMRRDDAYIADLDSAVSEFVARIKQERERLLAIGCKPYSGAGMPIGGIMPESPF